MNYGGPPALGDLQCWSMLTAYDLPGTTPDRRISTGISDGGVA